MKILVVDDSKTSLHVVGQWLKESHFTPTLVDSALKAINLLKTESFDGIVSDVEMPEMGGFEFAQYLRKTYKNWTPILFMSTVATDDYFKKGMESGGDFYLTKPLNKIIFNAFMEGFRRMYKMRLELENANHELIHNSLFDALTQLPNKKQLCEELADDISNTFGTPHTFGLLALELNEFKFIKDTFGHITADNLLIQVANRLANTLITGDMVARFSGDKFIFLLKSVTDKQQLQRFVETIMKEFIAAFTIKHGKNYVNVSLGGVLYDGREHISYDLLLTKADIALTSAKKINACSYNLYTSQLHQDNLQKKTLTKSLNNALANNEFQLYFQPQIDGITGKMVGAEVLLRWFTSQGKLIVPDIFIPLLEESGLIIEVTSWILESACQQWQKWQNEKLITPTCRVSINLAPNHFSRHDLVEEISSLIDKNNFPAQNLTLELTESSMMSSPDTSKQVMNNLKKLGVNLSLDDFGTGYSSLSHISEYPIDEIKIDKSFIDKMAASENDRLLLNAIIDMINSLNKEIVAEGIEDQITKDYLITHNCRVLQGYLYSKPLSIKDFGIWLKKQTA